MCVQYGAKTTVFQRKWRSDIQHHNSKNFTDLSGTDIESSSGAGNVTAAVSAVQQLLINNLSVAGVTLVGSADAKIPPQALVRLRLHSHRPTSERRYQRLFSCWFSKGDAITGGTGSGADTLSGGGGGHYYW